jgi:hypothetical protein
LHTALGLCGAFVGYRVGLAGQAWLLILLREVLLISSDTDGALLEPGDYNGDGMDAPPE